MSPGAEFVDGRQVLVTGGAGFIGSRLVARLVGLGAHVTVMDSLIPGYGGNLHNIESVRSRIILDDRDLRDASAVDSLVSGKDYIFCLAAQTSHMGSMEQPRDDVEINVVGQLNVLEACRRLNQEARLVYASTRQIYGTPGYLPVDEDHPVRPPDVNGVSKFAAEGYHVIYDRYHGIRSTILRLTNCYGPGMRIQDARQTFVGVWLRLALEGRPFAIYGDGKQRRDFNFGEDVVDALLLGALRAEAQGRIYNLGAQETWSLEELAALVVELVPGARFEHVPFPDERRRIDIGSCYSSFERIERELGWRPVTPLREGLRRTIDYYRQHFPHYVR